MVFTKEYTIRLEEIGLDNKATNRTILAIMEDIGSLHSESVGYGVSDIVTTRKGWVILDWKVRILKRPLYNETIQVMTWASAMDKVCAYRNFELKDAKGNTLAIGSSRWILMNIDKRRPERLDPELADLFKIEPDHHIFPEGDPDFKDLKNISEIQSAYGDTTDYHYQVERRDIDTNGHVHNLNYLDIAYEALPEDLYHGEECNNIRINYKKEIMYGQNIRCQHIRGKDSDINETNYIVMSHEDQINAVIVLD